ncbi:MAG: hypothetical protein H6718_13780 [Polyangiaceae bacterium]|nr:hypothetical protein [Myxococcales bacterium]MCB9586467.1 hypothetical protein [Polyangiaceae bacterium]MCB9605974.1 hypothetical protein [Polyangiaceae bacterium]
MRDDFKWTTPEQAIRDEVRYWASVTVEERVAAVETIRRATIGIYGDTPPRMERTEWVIRNSRGEILASGND